MNKDENYFLKEMIRTYYQPEIEKMKKLKEYLEYQLSQMDFEKRYKGKNAMCYGINNFRKQR